METDITKQQAASLVYRESPKLDNDGKPVMKDGEMVMDKVAVKPDEVLDYKVYPDKVVVVTVDGKKLTGALKKK